MRIFRDSWGDPIISFDGRKPPKVSLSLLHRVQQNGNRFLFRLHGGATFEMVQQHFPSASIFINQYDGIETLIEFTDEDLIWIMLACEEN